MKSIILLTTLVAVCNAQRPAALGAGAGIGGANTAKWTPFQCRDGTLGPNDDRMKEIGACEANNCVFFCHAVALGLLNDAGLPRPEIYDQWVKTTMPERHHQVGKAWFRDCYEKYGKFIDKSDASCQFAKQFGDCTWAVQPQLTCPKA